MLTYISTATSTYAHKISGIVANFTLGNTIASTITLYDGSVAADIASGNIIGVLEASTKPGEFFTGVNFTKGLIVVTAGASDITIQTNSAIS